VRKKTQSMFVHKKSGPLLSF